METLDLKQCVFLLELLMGPENAGENFRTFCKGGMGLRDICASLKTWSRRCLQKCLVDKHRTLNPPMSECLECHSGRCDAGVGCHW